MSKLNHTNIILLLLILIFPTGLLDLECCIYAKNANTYIVKTADNTSSRTFPGHVRSLRMAKLAFRVGGPIVKIHVGPGDMVKKDECLMQVDTRDYYDQLAVLKARKEQILVEKQNAKSNFERVDSLFKQNIVSQSKFDTNHTKLSSLEASLKVIDAQLRIINHQIKDTKLLAPYDCVINSQFAEAYEIINPGKPVIAISDVSHLEVEVDVPENEMVNLLLKKGEKAKLSFTFSPEKSYEITLKEWCIEAEPVTRTYKIIFKLLPPKGLQILPGMTAEIKWIAPKNNGEKPDLVVPALSVATDSNGKTFVWVYHKDTGLSTKREVEIGSISENNSFIVKDGLSVGEEIIVEGADFITNKTILTIKKASLNIE